MFPFHHAHSLLVPETTVCGPPNTAGTCLLCLNKAYTPCLCLPGKLSDMKSTWSSGPASHTQASLSHELWKVPRNTTAPTRPPPGLSNPKPSSTWGASPLGWTSSYTSGTQRFSGSKRGAPCPLCFPSGEHACHFVLRLLCEHPCPPPPDLGGLRGGRGALDSQGIVWAQLTCCQCFRISPGDHDRTGYCGPQFPGVTASPRGHAGPGTCPVQPAQGSQLPSGSCFSTTLQWSIGLSWPQTIQRRSVRPPPPLLLPAAPSADWQG